MTFIDGGDFTTADDVVYEPFTIQLKWRDSTQTDPALMVGVESFTVKGMCKTGYLLDIEMGVGSGVRGMLIDGLVDDDPQSDAQGVEIPESTSRDRFVALTHHKTREVPAESLNKITQGLYREYTERRENAKAQRRPTGRSAPSSPQQPPTGTGLTALSSTGGTTFVPSPQTVG